jgi:hypothetical protein
MFENPDMVMGSVTGAEIKKPDWYKAFIFAGIDSKITRHECLYEGKGAYEKLRGHVILAQITVKNNVENRGQYTDIENTPVGTYRSSLTPRDHLLVSNKLWRYLDYFKFEDLIKNQSLYYSRLDKFEDKLEGVSPYSCIKAIASDPEKNEEQKREAIRLYKIRMERNRQISFASCWHINDNLNFDMWDSYGHKASDSIAIKTSEKKLCSSLRKLGFPFLNEPVQYFDEPYFNQNAYWFPTMFKRKEYKSEQEFRSILFAHNISLGGIKIKVELNDLIDRIYVHPSASKQFFKEVRNFVKANSLHIPIRQEQK